MSLKKKLGRISLCRVHSTITGMKLNTQVLVVVETDYIVEWCKLNCHRLPLSHIWKPKCCKYLKPKHSKRLYWM